MRPMMLDALKKAWSSQSFRCAVYLLSTVAGVTFATMPRFIYIGDPYAWREEARHLLLEGKARIPASDALVMGPRGQYFVENEKNREWSSKYGFMATLAAAVPMAAELALTGELPAWDSPNRVLFLNLFNIVLALCIAWQLYRIALLFGASPPHAAGYVLAVSFGTFMWNYLRAHNTEILQVVFFLGFFRHLTLAARLADSAAGRREGWLSWAHLLALCLTKVSYVLLAPIAALALFTRDRRELAIRVIAPGIVLALTIALVNTLRFGAPWLSGYHQWNLKDHLPTGNLLKGLFDFTLDPQWSLFTHFPPLLFAIFGAREFARRYRAEARTIALMLGAFLLFVSMMPTHRGECCYGPRYLLFLLPIASLPALTLIREVLPRVGAGARRASLAAMGLALAASVFLQLEVNQYSFFAYYDLRNPIMNPEYDNPPELKGQFLHKPYGLVLWQFARAERTGRLGELPVMRFAPRGYAEQVSSVLAERNYYWFR